MNNLRIFTLLCSFFIFDGASSDMLDNVGLGFNPAKTMNMLNLANPYYGDWDEERSPTTEEIVARCIEERDKSEFCQKAQKTHQKEIEEANFRREVSQAKAYIEYGAAKDCTAFHTVKACKAARESIEIQRRLLDSLLLVGKIALAILAVLLFYTLVCRKKER